MNVLARKISSSLRRMRARFACGQKLRQAFTAAPVEPQVHSEGEPKDIWAERHLDPHYWHGCIHWGQVPQVAQYMNRLISGDPHVDFIDYTAQRYLNPLREQGPVTMLSLCTGIGQLELSFVKRGIADKVVGYEVSKECVQAANQAARKEGLQDRVTFIQLDLNQGTFAPEVFYDAILNEAALHHIKNLDHLIGECRRVSKPHTVFINHDYVGPNHNQWTEKQLSYINRIMAILPPALRGSLTNPGAIHEKKNALSMEEMLKIDPTEGVRSEEILPTMQKFFKIRDYKPYGGPILHMLLNDMARNFLAPEHAPLVDLLVLFEESLIDEGVLNTDFAYWIGTPD